MADEGLSVRELIKNTYDRLAERHLHQEIALTGRPRTEIADDSDWHRSRTGYMRYETANLFQFNDKTWAIARGLKCGQYPADPYDSDILALELSSEGKTEEQIREDLEEMIIRSAYFSKSLIFGMADGQLRVGTTHPYSTNPFVDRMKELLGSDISKFIAQELKTDEEHFTLDLRPLVKSGVKYKPEFVDYLADAIESVLE